ncbi:NAD(P)-dependent alcohol dehydrogenase [Glaciibacter superstes]|uniref:NAD(P)-dependent alcohol dehydrogenase n=1 Tax=Glaciibacter superstes TaxID=501023 RepID=UPI000403BE0D|nr:NAD(P)-dependent alcohol dehydrogenase [Glaciibacter superstes]
MRAVVYSKYGPPAVLRLEEVAKPGPKAGELLVAVRAASVNRTDCGFLSGKPRFVRLFIGLTRPKQSILGCEFAGRIEAVGAQVTTFEVGQRVFGYNGVNFGGHAEYLTIPEHGLVALIPAGMSYAEAAPSIEGAHYALNILRAARIARGQNVLIYGATGAIGSAAVQLAKHFGADVTAVCDTKNLALVKSLGADRVIDYTTEDFTRIDDDFDMVVDAVGKSSFRRCKPLLKRGGVYLSSDLGFMLQNPILALTTRLFGSKKVMFPIPRDTRDDVDFLKELMESREFRAVIDREYPLDDIREAYDYVASGVKIGNVVIRVENES